LVVGNALGFWGVEAPASVPDGTCGCTAASGAPDAGGAGAVTGTGARGLLASSGSGVLVEGVDVEPLTRGGDTVDAGTLPGGELGTAVAAARFGGGEVEGDGAAAAGFGAELAAGTGRDTTPGGGGLAVSRAGTSGPGSSAAAGAACPRHVASANVPSPARAIAESPNAASFQGRGAGA
jgi:hypothetical protein